MNLHLSKYHIVGNHMSRLNYDVVSVLKILCDMMNTWLKLKFANGIASANSAKFRGIRPRMYIEDLL